MHQPRSACRALVRLVGLFALAGTLVIPVILLWLLRLEGARAHTVHWFYNSARRLCGVVLKVEGNLCPERPLLLLANHSSYLDIFVLGSLAPMSFTPKREIRSWPVIGFFCVLADCVFIERRPAAMEDAKAEMEAKLKQGKVIALFPEGTTGDGFNIKPFKSGFLNLVETHDLPVQPVSLAYTHIGDAPLNSTTRELVAWIGEASLVTHMYRLLKLPAIHVTATYYEVLRRAQYPDRKALAKACEEVITGGLHQRLEANGVVS